MAQLTIEPIKQDVYLEQAKKVFESANIKANENEIRKIQEFLKKSDRWVSSQINLTKILLNTKDKELLLKIIDTIDKLDTNSKIKGQLLSGIANLSDDKVKSEINAAVYYIQTEEMNNIITNYESICGLDEIVFRIGRIGIRKNKREVKEIMKIFSEKETVDAVKKLTEKHKDAEQKVIAVGEVIHLISNSEIKDFIELRKNIADIVPVIKEEYNITHFGRHSSRFIFQLYNYAIGTINNESEKEGIGNSKKEKKKERIFIFAYSYSDHNGAFYSDSKHNDALSKYGKTIAIEASSDVELMLMIEKMYKKHGSFNGIFIAGHGEPTRVKLGKDDMPYSLFDVSDYDIMSKIGSMIDKEDKNSFIALISCSTGNEQSTRSLANIMASAANVPYVYAPEDSFTKYSLNIEEENKEKKKKTGQKITEERITVAYYHEKGTVQTMEFGIKKRE
ncbi:MAG: hypothetical protein QXW80_00980 [Candidatus Micrarchaeia archaeon]